MKRLVQPSWITTNVSIRTLSTVAKSSSVPHFHMPASQDSSKNVARTKNTFAPKTRWICAGCGSCGDDTPSVSVAPPACYACGGAQFRPMTVQAPSVNVAPSGAIKSPQAFPSPSVWNNVVDPELTTSKNTQKQLRSKQREWHCRQCSFVNDGQSSNCFACGAHVAAAPLPPTMSTQVPSEMKFTKPVSITTSTVPKFSASPKDPKPSELGSKLLLNCEEQEIYGRESKVAARSLELISDNYEALRKHWEPFVTRTSREFSLRGTGDVYAPEVAADASWDAVEALNYQFLEDAGGMSARGSKKRIDSGEAPSHALPESLRRQSNGRLAKAVMLYRKERLRKSFKDTRTEAEGISQGAAIDANEGIEAQDEDQALSILNRPFDIVAYRKTRILTILDYLQRCKRREQLKDDRWLKINAISSSDNQLQASSDSGLQQPNEDEEEEDDAIYIGSGRFTKIDFDAMSWVAESYVDTSVVLEEAANRRYAYDRIGRVPCIVEKDTYTVVRSLPLYFLDYFTSKGVCIYTRKMAQESAHIFYRKMGIPATLDPLFVGFDDLAAHGGSKMELARANMRTVREAQRRLSGAVAKADDQELSIFDTDFPQQVTPNSFGAIFSASCACPSEGQAAFLKSYYSQHNEPCTAEETLSLEARRHAISTSLDRLYIRAKRNQLQSNGWQMTGGRAFVKPEEIEEELLKVRELWETPHVLLKRPDRTAQSDEPSSQFPNGGSVSAAPPPMAFVVMASIESSRQSEDTTGAISGDEQLLKAPWSLSSASDGILAAWQDRRDHLRDELLYKDNDGSSKKEAEEELAMPTILSDAEVDSKAEPFSHSLLPEGQGYLALMASCLSGALDPRIAWKCAACETINITAESDRVQFPDMATEAVGIQKPYFRHPSSSTAQTPFPWETLFPNVLPPKDEAKCYACAYERWRGTLIKAEKDRKANEAAKRYQRSAPPDYIRDEGHGTAPSDGGHGWGRARNTRQLMNQVAPDVTSDSSVLDSWGSASPQANWGTSPASPGSEFVSQYGVSDQIDGMQIAAYSALSSWAENKKGIGGGIRDSFGKAHSASNGNGKVYINPKPSRHHRNQVNNIRANADGPGYASSHANGLWKDLSTDSVLLGGVEVDHGQIHLDLSSAERERDKQLVKDLRANKKSFGMLVAEINGAVSQRSASARRDPIAPPPSRTSLFDDIVESDEELHHEVDNDGPMFAEVVHSGYIPASRLGSALFNEPATGAGSILPTVTVPKLR